MRLGALLAIGLLSACGPNGVVGGSQPSDEDVLTSLQQLNRGPVFLDASATDCQPGTVEGRSVMVCGICAVAVTQVSQDPTYLRVERAQGTGAP